MAMDFMLLFPTLIKKSEFKERSNIGSLTGERDKNRDIERIVFSILAIRVEVDGPLIAADGEGVARDVFPYPHAFGEGVTSDGEVVGAIDCLGDGAGGRGRSGDGGGGGGHACIYEE